MWRIYIYIFIFNVKYDCHGDGVVLAGVSCLLVFPFIYGAFHEANAVTFNLLKGSCSWWLHHQPSKNGLNIL